MPLAMTRPYKHPKTGMYWVRKVIPEELRSIVGQRELKRSLKTKDPTEAKRLAPIVIAELEQTVARARLGQQFTREDLRALAGEYYRQRQAELMADARRRSWTPDDVEQVELHLDLVPDEGHTPDQEEAAVVAWGAPKVEALLARLGVAVTPAFRRQLAVELYRVERQAIHSAAAEVGFHEQTSPPSFPAFRSPVARSITALFKSYAESNELRSRTVEDWGRIVAHFDEWLGGKPADLVSPEDIQRYADELRTGKGLSGRKLSAKSVNESYLAAIRSTYSWAMKPGRALVSSNPAKGVVVETPRSERGPRRRGYTRDEVATILSAARLQQAPFKRWVPWLLAFTGARISEILNAKKADLGQAEGVWYLSIREQEEGESGEQLKNTWSTRCAPLHSALIKEGFLRYVESLPDGEHLFPGKWTNKHGDRTKTPANRLREWLKSVHLPEQGIAPNHSFRHWLISECKRAQLDPDFQRQLTGHATRDAHGQYGPADVPVMREQLERIPSPL